MSRHHAAPSGHSQELLYDPDVATPSHAERARTMVVQLGTGTLCTVAQEPEGFPYGSFVTVAFEGGNPVFLISKLAEHTKNLEGDQRASLLVAEAGAEDPLANGRVTLLGPCERIEGEAGSARETFLAAHPKAAYYADYGDFSFFRLSVEAIRYIGGYGRMSWITKEEWLAAEPDPLTKVAAGIIGHMNDGHADALATYCKALSKATDTTSATMTGVDRYGFEMSASTGAGPRPIRLAFAEQVTTSDGARKALIAMLGDARARLGTAAE